MIILLKCLNLASSLLGSLNWAELMFFVQYSICITLNHNKNQKRKSLYQM